MTSTGSREGMGAYRQGKQEQEQEPAQPRPQNPHAPAPTPGTHPNPYLALTPALALALALALTPAPLHAQRAADVNNQDRYDDIFRKYSKRFFGPAFDWHYFKAQGLAESGLDPKARSPVGARGVMQLMPGTYAMIRKARSESFGSIEDPEWNIAAGILFSRDLWHVWADNPDEQERLRFMFGSYNAGQGTIKRATTMARARKLDAHEWQSIEEVAPNVKRWRYTETLPYVRKIEENHKTLTGASRSKLRKKPDQ